MSVRAAHGEPAASTPRVSVIMANYRGAAHIEAALRSVLAQTLGEIEVIVSDDCSPDASLEIVRGIMAEDDRVRLVAAETNGGPASARNRALDRARGDWVAIVDSDDLIHPERFERLLARAERDRADGIADDLLFFSDAGAAVSTLLGDTVPARGWSLSACDFVRSNIFGAEGAALGYLKPMLRRSRLSGLRYDETLRIGEDYDFLLRFLLSGAPFVLLPDLFYLYRRHSGSISHRLSEQAVTAMMASQTAFVDAHGPFDAALTSLFDARFSSLQRAAAFERLVAAVKARRFASAARQVLRQPRLVLPLLRSAMDNLSRRFRRDTAPGSPESVVAAHGGLTPRLAQAVKSAFGDSRREHVVNVCAYPDPSADDWSTPEARRSILSFVAAPGANTRIIAFGKAGVFAAGFLTGKAMTAIVESDPAENAFLREAARRYAVPLIVAADTGVKAKRLPFPAGQTSVRAFDGSTHS